jgi:hypothetical protein
LLEKLSDGHLEITFARFDGEAELCETRIDERDSMPAEDALPRRGGGNEVTRHRFVVWRLSSAKLPNESPTKCEIAHVGRPTTFGYGASAK